MSIMNTHWARSFLVATTLTLSMTGCLANPNSRTSSVTVNPIRTQTSTAVTTEASTSSANHFANTYLFDIRDVHSAFGKAHPHEASRYSSAFNALLAEQIKQEKHFIPRITSGPSTQGQIFDIDGQAAVIHVTCQAHRCHLERMSLLYFPASGMMAAILWTHCAEKVFGNPTASAEIALRMTAKMPSPTPLDIASCKKESAAYE